VAHIRYYDRTQKVLRQYLNNTENRFNELLSEYGGNAKIKTTLDLGFPHDVIRIAGGFATGVYVEWDSSFPIIPVDTCVNVCTCSFFEVSDNIQKIFKTVTFKELNKKLANSIYMSNFHRGNHFISFLKSQTTSKLFLLLHSSAFELERKFNGLYPIAENWYYDKIETYVNKNGYIRYISGSDAELFFKIAQHSIPFNENRHEFIAHQLLQGITKVQTVEHHHHYFMPNNHSVVMGNYVIKAGDIAPILTLPGENIYRVKFKKAKFKELYIDNEKFLVPHGWGKRHKTVPALSLDILANKFYLDKNTYDIVFGESLRDHPNLELRDFQTTTCGRKEKFFSVLGEMYEYSLIDELSQVVSYNKLGVRVW
jgi:hypothetical protein